MTPVPRTLAGVPLTAHAFALLAPAALVAALVFSAPPARATTLLTTVRVASGLTRPVFVASPPGDPRLFVVEQRGSDRRGRIKIVKNGVVLSRPFLVTKQLANGNEQGLLGLAFAPDYATSGVFYINYTDTLGTTRIERHLVSSTDPDSANSTGELLLLVSQPFVNHNAGWLGFGPDGKLYIPLGDGGSGGDPGNRAQNPDSLLGKILRIDVGSTGPYTIPPDNPFVGVAGRDEIWSLGTRNPFRCSFDRVTGDFVIADVGQELYEEIDFAPAADGGARGANFGWHCWEADTPYDTNDPTPCVTCANTACFEFPVYNYTHVSGLCSITGGYVYRGCAIPDLRGTYFFADYCTAQIWSGKLVPGALNNLIERTAELAPGGTQAINSVSSFGEDADGELYICDLADGEVYKIVPRTNVAEGDLPLLRATNAGADTVGTTTLGNAFTNGIVPAMAAGSRVKGAGYLRDAALRSCVQTTANSLVAALRLGSWDIDLTAAVNPDSATITRTFLFTNRAAFAQVLDFRDVIAPFLEVDNDVGATYSGSGPAQSAFLALTDADLPTRWVQHIGYANGAAFGADVDTRAAIESRIAQDAALSGQTSAGPGRLALALSFDFGSLAPAASATVQLVTKVAHSAPLDTDPPPLPVAGGPFLRLAGAMPFRGALRIALDLPVAAQVRLAVYDVVGRRVRALGNDEFAAGSHFVTWDGRDDRGVQAPAGLYLVRATTPFGDETVRAMRIR